ncbi:hypothetical protein EC919_108283 [Pseudomonas graminis]|uniref:hypothetical protein n=1 Tax=Pseudomonas graminis TaxID=158627 RepID=UPI0010611457|nr:hypothetical protein [Pseudomonas graminis]TDV49305.1 hypothetical protein EC919_108283 [Pseudomonas graminis]
MKNILENGDFQTGELAPWTSTTGEASWTIKTDDEGPYIQLIKAADLSQTTPQGTYKPTTLTFEVRAGEVVKPDDLVVFGFGIVVYAAGEAQGFGDIWGATNEWRTVTFPINRKPTPATMVTVQFFTASDPERLKVQAGTVHFRNFQLIE